jgi:hypothetical protein
MDYWLKHGKYSANNMDTKEGSCSLMATNGMGKVQWERPKEICPMEICPKERLTPHDPGLTPKNTTTHARIRDDGGAGAGALMRDAPFRCCAARGTAVTTGLSLLIRSCAVAFHISHSTARLCPWSPRRGHGKSHGQPGPTPPGG